MLQISNIYALLYAPLIRKEVLKIRGGYINYGY